MQNYLNSGSNVTVTAPEDLTSGRPVAVGSLFGIAATDAASGDEVVIQTAGAANLPKVSGQAWAVGDVIYWSEAANLCTTVSAPGLLEIGVAIAAAANPSDAGAVRFGFGVPQTVA